MKRAIQVYKYYYLFYTNYIVFNTYILLNNNILPNTFIYYFFLNNYLIFLGQNVLRAETHYTPQRSRAKIDCVETAAPK